MHPQLAYCVVEGEGFEPSKAEPSDLQSDPFDRSGTPPNETVDYARLFRLCQRSHQTNNYPKAPSSFTRLKVSGYFHLRGFTLSGRGF